MSSGDMVLVMILAKTAGINETLDVATTGGQSWYTLAWDTQGAISWALLACRFNGTWAANPTFQDGQGQTTPLTAKMDVFRPTSGAKIMDIDWSPVAGSFAAGTTPFTKTITGITTRNAGAAAVAYWMSQDDNTWGSLTAGWSNAGGTQIRNASGTQTSVSTAYQVFATAQATGNVSQNQATLGGDAGATCILSIYEHDAFLTTVPALDGFWDAENSTNGTTLTTTIMDNGTHLLAANGSWQVAGTGTDNMTVATAAQAGFGTRSVTVNATSYTDSSGTRGMSLDHANQGGSSRFFAWTKSADVAKCSYGVWFTTTLTYGLFDSFSLAGMQDAGFAGSVCLNIANYESSQHRIWHENSDGTIKMLGRLAQSTRVWVSGYFDQATNYGRMILFDTSYNQIGFQTAQILGASPANFHQVNLGSFGGNFPATGYTGTVSQFDDLCFDFTNAAYPLGPATAAAGGSTSHNLMMLGVGN